MSMSYELMMKNKGQIMYATIKGSLTESPEGVFSGFSGSDYLKLPKIDFSGEWEILLNFKTSNNANTSLEYIFGSETTNRGILLDYNNGVLKLWLSGNGTSWNILSNQGTYQIQANTEYYVRLSYKNSAYKFEVSTDKNNWVDGATITSTTPIYNDTVLYIGSCWDRNTSAMKPDGNFNLNNSYIKLGSTKYKLQAVVGYTVVGSPTITDGVVSGFSDSNYLNLQKLITEENNLEIKIKFTTGNDITSGQYPMAWSSVVNGSNRNGGFYISNGRYGIVARDTTDTNYQRTGGRVNTNTFYFGKIIFNLATKNLKVGISTDDVNYTYDVDITLSGNLAPMNRYIWFGRAIPNNYSFGGSIDMNETTIKINNKLWFNGQQA